MFLFEIVLPSLLTGAILVFYSQFFADFFRKTGSVNLIRGMDSAGTYKVLGYLIALGYPLYQLLTVYIISISS